MDEMESTRSERYVAPLAMSFSPLSRHVCLLTRLVTGLSVAIAPTIDLSHLLVGVTKGPLIQSQCPEDNRKLEPGDRLKRRVGGRVEESELEIEREWEG